MPTFNEILLIFGMMAVTFSVRYLPLLMIGHADFPASLERALRFVPVAVLTALVMPMILLPQGEWALSFNNPYLVASIVAIVVSMWRRSLMLTIVIGLVVFFMWRQWFG